jgi:hypothetical protein
MKHVDFSPKSRGLQLKNRRGRIFRACHRLPRMFFPPKAGGPSIHYMLTESILAISEAEFRVYLVVGFIVEHIIANHGSMLKVADIRLKSMSLLNNRRYNKSPN